MRRGKPAPGVYLESLRRLNVSPENTLEIEDSSNGLQPLKVAGITSIAVTKPSFPLTYDALLMADYVLNSLVEFSPGFLEKIECITE